MSLKCFLDHLIAKYGTCFELQGWLERVMIEIEINGLDLNSKNLRQIILLMVEEFAVEMEFNSTEKRNVYDVRFRRGLEALHIVNQAASKYHFNLSTKEIENTVLRIFKTVGLRVPEQVVNLSD